MSNLETFALSFNKLTGDVPSFIGDFPKLENLAMAYNNYRGTIPESFAQLTKMKLLDLSGIGIPGEIPSFISNYIHLTAFAISDNQLKGRIPSSFFDKMTQLGELYLYANSFTGPIFNMTSLTKMANLVLYENYFSSTIPAELSTMTKLKEVFLHANKLTGPIVPITSPDFESYDVRSNVLTGKIPSSLFKLPALKMLSASDNCLSTDLSDISCNTTKVQSLFLNVLGQSGRSQLFFLSSILLHLFFV